MQATYRATIKSYPVNDYTTISSNIDASVRMMTPDFMDGVILEDAQATLSLPPPCQTSTDHGMTLGDQIDAISFPSPRNSKSPVDPSLSLTNSLPTAKPQRGRSQKTPTVPKAPSSLSTKDIFNFNSSSSLTYDSFWSSHTGPMVPQLTRGSHNDGIADHLPTFQTSDYLDYNNEIATTQTRPLNNPPSTTNDIIPQLNPDLRRNFSVPA